MAVITVLLLVGCPNFSVSEFKCGFQWGIISIIKWLAKAKGIAIRGLGILDAMAAPIKTWGVSSIVRVMLYNWFMLVNLGITILGILIFLFIFWKRLRDDYAAEIIFKSATYILVGIAVGWAISSKFFPVWFFWASITGGLTGFSFAILKFRVKFYETLEALIIAFLPWLGLIFLIDSVTRGSLNSFLAFTFMLIMIFASYYFDTHYKRFSWYKSGRIGFAGLATATVFFLVRSLIAIGKVPMLSFVGQSEAVVAGAAALVSFILLFNLGRIRK